MRFYFTCVIALVLPVLLPRPSGAWHKDGHMAIARVAWYQLADEQRAYFTTLLKTHPHYDVYLSADRPKEVTEPEWAFVRSATWSDWIRDPSGNGLTTGDKTEIKRKFNKPDWHFVNLPYIHPADVCKFDAAAIRKEVLEPEFDDKSEPRHALAALKQCMEQLKASDGSDAEKAVKLCWLMHLVGDVHQPLHCATLIASKDTFDPPFDPPHGDEGGNRLAIKLKTGDPSATILHYYWDDLLFNGDPPFEKVDTVATSLLTKFKRDQLPELSASDLSAWAEESLDLAKTVVYKGGGGFLKAYPLPAKKKFDPKGVDAPVLPDGYQQAAEAVAERRMVLAGYRLADQLKLVLQARK